MKKYIIYIIYISIIFSFIGCNEKTFYSGKIMNINDGNYDYANKLEVTNDLGAPSYIDPIEKKYFYFYESRKSKNFFDNTVDERLLLVFNFNSDGTINSFNKYDLNNENNIELIEDETSNEIIKQGLIEKLFGGVGKTPIN